MTLKFCSFPNACHKAELRIFILSISIFLIGCSSRKIYRRIESPELTPAGVPHEIYQESEFGSTPKNAEYSRAPIIEKQFPPEYPPQAFQNGFSGLTILNIEILVNGQVGMIEIVESSGYEILDDAAMRSAKNWRFTPAFLNNAPVAVWVKFPIEFKLE